MYEKIKQFFKNLFCPKKINDKKDNYKVKVEVKVPESKSEPSVYVTERSERLLNYSTEKNKKPVKKEPFITDVNGGFGRTNNLNDVREVSKPQPRATSQPSSKSSYTSNSSSSNDLNRNSDTQSSDNSFTNGLIFGSVFSSDNSSSTSTTDSNSSNYSSDNSSSSYSSPSYDSDSSSSYSSSDSGSSFSGGDSGGGGAGGDY